MIRVSQESASTRAPGSLREVIGSGPDALPLATVPLEQLAGALLERIRSSPPPASWSLSQLSGILDLELESWACVHQNRFSRQWLADLFAVYTGCPEHLPPIAGSVVVELGCGGFDPFALLMLFVLLGARRGIGVDLDPVYDARLAARGLARCAMYLLADPPSIAGSFAIEREAIARSLGAFDLDRLWRGDLAGVDRNRLEFRNDSAANLSLGDAEADLLLSNSFLEHVADVDDVIREMARVTRPGGCGVHQIDGMDHAHHGDPARHPLDFLRVETDAAMVGGCNRVRPMGYVRLFEEHGFDVVRTRASQRVAVDEQLRAGFAKPFRSMPTEHLEVAVATLFVRRR
jgi:SAM-dependent methyltransferase